MAKKKGRPEKIPKEKMYFGILCTEVEAEKARDLMRRDAVKGGRKMIISDYWLRLAGIR